MDTWGHNTYSWTHIHGQYSWGHNTLARNIVHTLLQHSFKWSLYLMRSSHTSTHLQKKSTCFSSRTSPHSHSSQMLEPPCHLQDSTLKWCARNMNLLKLLNTCLSKSLRGDRYSDVTLPYLTLRGDRKWRTPSYAFVDTPGNTRERLR